MKVLVSYGRGVSRMQNAINGFKVDLSEAHRQSGRSIYRVAKDTNLSINTVTRYVKQPLTVDRLESAVIALSDYYGVEWQKAVTVVRK